MSRYDYDLFVLGAGSGGVRASRIAAGYGKRVAVAEESRVGGTCVIRGCVPKKLLVMASHYGEAFEDAAGFGWTVGETSFDWGRLIERKNAEIDRLNQVYIRIMRDRGVEIIDGTAKLVDPHTVEVAGKRVTAEHILIATGGWPHLPDVPGIEHAITSNEALDLPSLPRRVVVVGGGYIAVEFAGIFHAAGAQVTQMIRGDRVLRGFDDDLRTALQHEMVTKGIDIRVDTTVKGIEKCADGSFSVRTSEGEFIACDAVMYATGRMPKTRGIGLEEVGVKLDQHGAVIVDQFSKTSVDNIYAVGDCTNRVNLTPVALAEGHAVADCLYGGMCRSPDYENIPSAVFSQPPVATVGLTEAKARALYGKVDVYVSRFKPMRNTLAGRDERTLMKMVVRRDDQVVLGMHMCGPDAPEIIQGFAVALKCGATKQQVDSTVGIHPTAAEEFVTMREPVPEPTPALED